MKRGGVWGENKGKWGRGKMGRERESDSSGGEHSSHKQKWREGGRCITL